MYNDFFGFRESPFTVTPDPRIFYSTSLHQRVYADLLSGICARKGIVILTGEAGTGKTTILRRLMANLKHTVRFAFCPYATLSFDELLDFVCDDLELPQKPQGRAQQLEALQAFLITQQQRSQYAALLIDEAHHLQPSVLTALAELANYSVGDEVLLPIVLVGQQELEQNLSAPTVAALHRRIAISCQLDRLKSDEVGPFIFHRLSAVGCHQHEIFPPQIVQAIAEYSQGIPRYINTICDNALLIAHIEKKQIVTIMIIEEVAQDLQLPTLFPFHREPESAPHRVEALSPIAVAPPSSPPPTVVAAPMPLRREPLLQPLFRFFAPSPLVTSLGLGMVGILLLVLFSRPPLPAAMKLAARHEPPPKSGEVKTTISPTTSFSASPQSRPVPSSQQRSAAPAEANKKSQASLAKAKGREITVATVSSNPIAVEREPKKTIDSWRNPFAVMRLPEVATAVRPLPPKDDSPLEIKTQRASAAISNGKGLTALMQAVMRGRTAAVQELLNNGVEVNTQNAAGRTALMLAALTGRNDILQILIKSGAAVNAKNDEGWTALMYAAWNGHAKTVQMLIRNGAQVEMKNAAGGTALSNAVRNGHYEIARILRTGNVRASTQNLPAKSAEVGMARSRDVRSLTFFKQFAR